MIQEQQDILDRQGQPGRQDRQVIPEHPVTLDPVEWLVVRVLVDSLDRLAVSVVPVLLDHREQLDHREARDLLDHQVSRVDVVTPDQREHLERLVSQDSRDLQVRWDSEVSQVRLACREVLE